MRFFFYSHDGLGLGHTRRHCAVAAALMELAPNASVLLASGTDEVHRLGLPASVEVLKLPSLRKTADGEYVSRRLGLPAAEIKAIRSELLSAAARSFKPDVVLVDKHPLGASGEFKQAMTALKANGARMALGLRDILDEPAVVLKEWSRYKVRKTIEAYYDSVLVYGDRSVFDAVSMYEFSKPMGARTRMCGYVVNRGELEERQNGEQPFKARHDGRPVVLAATGGGEDGFFLLDTFIRAAKGASWKGVLIAGPMIPEYELKTLRRLAADAKVELRTFVPHLAGLFWSIDALVCMGGYNTLAEAVAQGVPTICVPRISPRKEQLIRAKAFERLGLMNVICPDELNVGLLREVMGRTLTQSRQQLLDRSHKLLDFDGARQAANHLLALATDGAKRRTRRATPESAA